MTTVSENESAYRPLPPLLADSDNGPCLVCVPVIVPLDLLSLARYDSSSADLKELISRLQEENAKLRSTSAPQSDFTFTIPPAQAQGASVAPGSNGTPIAANNNNGNNKTASTFNNNDIVSFLSSAPPPPQPSQSPFTMINPSPPPQNANSAMGSLDDWMNNWNSSAFGTELPQAVPPYVTNLAEQPADNGFASLWNNLNQGNASTFNTLQTQQEQQQNVTENNNALFSLFQHAFSPSLENSSSSANPSPAQYVNSSNTPPYTNAQAIGANMFPFANASSNGASPDVSSSNGGRPQMQQQQQNYNNNNTNNMHMSVNNSTAASPETCASSTSGGSDPSDAQPSTPTSGQVLFGNDNKSNSKAQSGDSVQSLYADFGLSAFTTGGMQNHRTNSGSSNNMLGGPGFESATTPSGVFDMMNYRDPLLSNLSGDASSGNGFDFNSFLAGTGNSNTNLSNINGKGPDNLDFSDFLVASPPGLTQSPPVTGNMFQMPGNNGHQSNSSSSIPTLGSLSSGASPSSTLPSPQTSLNTGSSSGGASSTNGTPNWLPHDIPYSHPLIQHVLKDQVQKDKQDFDNQMKAIPRKSLDVDGLCSDMQMKATCKDHARERLAKALQTDEMTMKLYNDYLSSAGANNGGNGQTQRTSSPNYP